MSARFERYTLDGIKLTHDIGFGVTDDDGFDVYINRTKLDKGLDFDVIGSVEELRKGDGKITLKAAHAASDVLLILSDTLARRVTNFAKAARFEESEIDNEFDNLLRLLEDAALNLQSTPYFDPTDVGLVDGKLPPIIANGVLRINANGNGFELILLDELPELQEIIRKATEQADRSESEANRSESEANRSGSEADRAQGIADALGIAPSGDYKGLWPDSGGAADEGDTWQTQTDGSPTGRYFAALKNTTADPVGDDVNWREVVSAYSLQNYTDLVYPSEGVNSPIQVMLDAFNLKPLSYQIGTITSAGSMQFKYKDTSAPITLSNFTVFKDVFVDAFGENADGLNSDSAVIQSAYDYWRTNIKKNNDGTTILGASPKLVFSGKRYAIGETVDMTNPDSSYLNVDFNDAIFEPTASFDQSTFAFDIYVWQTRLSNFQCVGFEKPLNLFNPNINAGRIIFDGVQIHDAKQCFQIEARSSTLTIKNFNFINCSKVARVIACDKLNVKDGWINGGLIENSYDGYFELDSDFAPSVLLDNCFYVPRVGQPEHVGICYIRKPGSVRIINSLFGGEASPIPSVINAATQEENTGGLIKRGIQILIADGSIYSSGQNDVPMVELLALPDQISITNTSGGIEGLHVESLIYFDESVRTFNQALSDSFRDPRISVDGIQPINFSGIPNASKYELARFFVTRPPVIYRADNSVSTASPSIILEKKEAGRGRCWKVFVHNQSNPGTDRYSEYFVTSNAGQAPNSVFSILPIIEGASTVAGRVGVDGLGNLTMFPNSGTATSLVCEIQQMCSVTEQYL